MATNIKLNNDTTNNIWTYSPQIDSESGNTLILNTANKFLDKDIKIILPGTQQTQTNASGFNLSISNVSGNSEVIIGSTNSGGYYPVTANNLSITGTFSASTAGLFNSDSGTDNDVDNASVGKIKAGSYSASVSHSITTTPIVTKELLGTITNIGTTTKPSGTDGTDYWTITSNGTVTTTGISTASGKATIDTAGYIKTGNTSSSDSTIYITPNIENGTISTLYIPKAVYSISAGVTTITAGGYLPANTKVTDIATINPSTSYSNTGMSNYFTAGTSSDYNVTITPNYTNSAGYVEAHNAQNNGGIGYWKIKTTSLTAGNGNLVLTKGNGEAILEVETGDSASSNNTSLDMKTTTPSSGVYYTLTAIGKGTVSGVGKGTVNVGTGWITGTSIESSEDSGSETSYEDIVHGYILKSVHGNAVSGALPSSLTRTTGTYQDIEIQPKGYIKIPKGYNPIDKYIFANIADELSEARAASGYSLSISSVSGSDTVIIGAYSNGYYPVTANNLSIKGTLSASTAGWFSSGEATDNDTDSVTVGKIKKAAGSTTCVGGDLTWTNGNATIVNSSTTGVTIKVTRAAITATSTITTAGYTLITPNNDSFSTDTLTEATDTKYITGVTLTAGKEFNITVPNGSSGGTITFHFAVDVNGNTTIT